MGSTRHRPSAVLQNGQQRCNATGCSFTGSGAEMRVHIRYGVTRQPDGSWTGPANLTAASLPDMLTQLGVTS